MIGGNKKGLCGILVDVKIKSLRKATALEKNDRFWRLCDTPSILLDSFMSKFMVLRQSAACCFA